MSHRDDCLSRREAERRGERDYEYSGYRTYSYPEDVRGCREAERAYDDGQRYAEHIAEEEAAKRRAAESRREQQTNLERQWREQSEYEEHERQEHLYYERMYEQQMEIELAVAEVWGDGP